jgi:hypothetical protein
MVKFPRFCKLFLNTIFLNIMETLELPTHEMDIQTLTAENLQRLPPEECKRLLADQVQLAIDEGLYDRTELLNDTVDDVLEYDLL